MRLFRYLFRRPSRGAVRIKNCGRVYVGDHTSSNSVRGTITGTVVQAHDVQGNIHLGPKNAVPRAGEVA